MNWKDIPNNLSGLYLYENTLDGKKYVGQSINLRIRIRDHERNFTRNTISHSSGECVYLWRAVRKYGRENFILSIILECEPEELNDLEIKYIKEFKSHQSENGYNFSWGGNQTNKGMKLSDETKKKMSLSRIGTKNPFFGKTHSLDVRDAISKWRKENKSLWYKTGKEHHNYGKKWDEERREEKSIKDLGKNNPAFGKKHPNSLSKYLGVRKDGKYWVAIISYMKKRYYIKSCLSEIDAARAYNEFIIRNGFPHKLNDLGEGL